MYILAVEACSERLAICDELDNNSLKCVVERPITHFALGSRSGPAPASLRRSAAPAKPAPCGPHAGLLRRRARGLAVHRAFPTGLAPFIRLFEQGKRQAVDGHFGPLPQLRQGLTYDRRTCNDRSETVAKLQSFRDA